MTAAGANKEENALKLKEQLEGLVDVIDTACMWPKWGLTLTLPMLHLTLFSIRNLTTKKVFKSYQNHPEHLKIVDFVGEIRTDRAVVDYEI